ncbi:MAG TPA: S41 family peptidase [Tepidisphaeraceae bacterium]|nr:S41 family peptidase [Tepidisphaeraceae bacterium]
MRRALRRAVLVAAIAGVSVSAWMLPGRGVAAQNTQVAELQQLEMQAVKEAQAGHFDASDQILGKARTLSNNDKTVEQMANWTSSFKTQLQSFAAERHKQFEELVTQVKLLLSHDKADYALDVASRAYLLSDDKPSFRNEAWVDQLVKQSIERAAQYDQKEEWIKSLRIYSDLGAIEPSVPQWKDQLKLATRRVRLLAMYTPEVLKSLQESEVKDREQVEQLLHPTTQPATQPAAAATTEQGDKVATAQPTTQPAKKDGAEKIVNDNLRVDWHETLRGVQMEMLWEALVDADQNYYRGISYKDMAAGGVRGLRAVLTTQGLEKAFPKLSDADRRNEFLSTLDKVAADCQNAAANGQQNALRNALTKIQTVNRDTVNLPAEVLVSEFADGAFEKLDPFTSMIWPSDLEEFNKTTQGKFSGVGIQIQSDEDGSLRVVSPLEDTPAFKAGIKAGDIVTHIDGKSAKGISINQAVRVITGPPHTVVKLTVKSPDGKVKEYPIHRETIHVVSVKGYVHRPGGGWDYVLDPQTHIGYIRITNFTADTSSELNSAIETMKLQHVRGLIMDLRYNPGGLLTAATDVVDKFLDHGVIVSTRPDRDTGNQPTIAVAKPDADDSKLPLVVLVNQYSASASEIVSGALKDDHRATIVGERTFGKGSVQMLFPISDRSAYLKLTTSHYYLPSGRCIHREENSKEWGVDPDVTVPLTPDQMSAAIDARQDLDVLRDAPPAAGEQPKLNGAAKVADPKNPTAPKKDLLASDPQLSAAVLLLRMKLTGADL